MTGMIAPVLGMGSAAVVAVGAAAMRNAGPTARMPPVPILAAAPSDAAPREPVGPGDASLVGACSWQPVWPPPLWCSASYSQLQELSAGGHRRG